jgi:hypothetical protein
MFLFAVNFLVQERAAAYFAIPAVVDRRFPTSKTLVF